MNLDLEQLKYLSDEQKNRYMTLERLFSAPGWKMIVALAELRQRQLKDRAAFAKDWDQNRIAVGAGAAWEEVATLESATQAEYETMATAAKDAQDLQDAEDYE